MRPPPDYANWCNQVQGTVNEDYRCLQNPEKESLHKALLTEQGGLCAYTMRRVVKDTSHIEHIKPETLCRSERVGSDLDYDNLVACFPLEGAKQKYRYGAQQKGDWWENEGTDFVSPLNQRCESRFRFDLEGKISAVRKHTSALKTIQILRLDHDSLTEDRKRVIEEFVYGNSRDNPISGAKTARLIETICARDADGNFREFCVAVRHALNEHWKNLKKLAARRRFAGTR
ncbi:MAG: retron system putative HNH endonuclease [Pseudomonadota bacterium]